MSRGSRLPEERRRMAFGQPDTSPVHEHGDLPPGTRSRKPRLRSTATPVPSPGGRCFPVCDRPAGAMAGRWYREESVVFLPAPAGLRLPGHVQGLVEVTEDFELPSIDAEESVRFPATGDRPPRSWWNARTTGRDARVRRHQDIAALIAAAATTSSTVAPRERSQTGRAKPCRNGPIARAPPTCSTSL